MAAKRFPDRDEIAAVHAEAERARARRGGRRGAPARRPRARAARDGEARLPRPRRPVGPHPAALPRRTAPARSTCTSATSSARSASRRSRAAASRRSSSTALELLAQIHSPLPDTFHGLTDVEQRYRRRYLDLLMNEETRADFMLRARMVTAIRRALDDDGFVEVETPVLQPRYGGAFARPFVDAPQRARPDALPAHRDRALPQAPDRRRPRARLRDRQGLPQRGHLVQAQPRVHDARVVRGLRRLRGHDGADGAARRARRRGDGRHDEGHVPRPRDRPRRPGGG